jgi:glycosyltransferase involved in cell wall biosynthesis
VDQREPNQPPKISVVIASVNGRGYLDDCLRALENQTLKDQAEVIVVDCCGDGVTAWIRRQYPSVKLLSFPERKTIPELRAIGMKQARGGIVALTEDHCLAEPHWYERILLAHQTHYGAIGGAVENDPSIKRAVDWAVFFCEYSPYMKPILAGEVPDIPGNNLSYRREFLAHLGDLLDDGRSWESSLNARLRQNGIRLYSDPSIVVYHKKVFGFRYFISQRYHYARSYAGLRVANSCLAKGILYALFCPLLPGLLVGRISRQVVSKRRHVDQWARALPFLALFTLVWAWGEFVGYLCGPGESLLQVE